MALTPAPKSDASSTSADSTPEGNPERSALRGQSLALQLSALSPFRDGSAPGAVDAAAQGLAGQGGPLPHQAAIQRSFGRHDVSGIDAHVGGAAADASQRLGARGYAMDNAVGFAEQPDLHTAAHEAAHVIQQRSGTVQLAGGMGRVGDEHERHADAVADAVVAGKSAEGLLDQYGESSAASTANDGQVQLYDTDVRSNLGAQETQLGVNFIAKWAKKVTSNARELVRPWLGIRKDPDHEFPKATATGLGAFLFKQRTAISKEIPNASPTVHREIIDQVMTQAKAELKKGTFRDHLLEIRLLHKKGQDLCDWLGIEVNDDCHKYDLTVTTLQGISGSGGLGAGISKKQYTVKYSNSVLKGLDWDFSFTTGEADLIASTPGVSYVADDTTEYSSLKQRHYQRPSFFTDEAGLTTITIEASVAGGLAFTFGDSMVMFSDGVEAVTFVKKNADELGQRAQINFPDNITDLTKLKSFLKNALGAGVSQSIVEVIVDEDPKPHKWEIGDHEGEFDPEIDPTPGVWLLMHQGDLFFESGESELTEKHTKTIDKLVNRMNSTSYQPMDAEFQVKVTGVASARWDAIEHKMAALEKKREGGRISTEDYRVERDQLLDKKRTKNEELALLRAYNVHTGMEERLELPDVKIDKDNIKEAMDAGEYDADLTARAGKGDFSRYNKDQKVQVDVWYYFKPEEGAADGTGKGK